MIAIQHALLFGIMELAAEPQADREMALGILNDTRMRYRLPAVASQTVNDRANNQAEPCTKRDAQGNLIHEDPQHCAQSSARKKPETGPDDCAFRVVMLLHCIPPDRRADLSITHMIGRRP